MEREVDVVELRSDRVAHRAALAVAADHVVVAPACGVAPCVDQLRQHVVTAVEQGGHAAPPEHPRPASRQPLDEVPLGDALRLHQERTLRVVEPEQVDRIVLAFLATHLEPVEGQRIATDGAVLADERELMPGEGTDGDGLAVARRSGLRIDDVGIDPVGPEAETESQPRGSGSGDENPALAFSRCRGDHASNRSTRGRPPPHCASRRRPTYMVGRIVTRPKPRLEGDLGK